MLKRSDAGPYFWIVPGECVQEHDAPHPLALLRARRERQRRRAAEQRDECAASLDHLVGAGKQRRRHVEAKPLGRFQVYH